MAFSTDVRLPRDREPVFPDRCVSCGRGEPGATFRVRHRPIRWFSVMTIAPGGRRHVVHAPACDPCADRMGNRRIVSTVITIALVLLGVFLVVWLLGEYDGPMRKLLGIAGALVALSPWILIEVFWPPAFDTTVFKDEVDYEFLDAEYADEFESLNG